jgi:hypothetical protein
MLYSGVGEVAAIARRTTHTFIIHNFTFLGGLRVFEHRMLMKIFGQKREEVTGGWRKLHNEKLHNVYSSPSVIRMIKSRRMRWAGM